MPLRLKKYLRIQIAMRMPPAMVNKMPAYLNSFPLIISGAGVKLKWYESNAASVTVAKIE